MRVRSGPRGFVVGYGIRIRIQIQIRIENGIGISGHGQGPLVDTSDPGVLYGEGFDDSEGVGVSRSMGQAGMSEVGEGFKVGRGGVDAGAIRWGSVRLGPVEGPEEVEGREVHRTWWWWWWCGVCGG